jgi:hypothetical protein
MTTCDPLEESIAANVVLLDHRVRQAADAARAALLSLEEGNRNTCIGTLLPLVEEMKLATALLETIFTLHRLPTMRLRGVQ